MDPSKVGEFIKKIRKENHLTQKELGEKYHVTYQAVSKWENGKNLPDVSLLHQMSKDFSVSIEDILDGKKTRKKRNYYPFMIALLLIFMIIILSLWQAMSENSFKFKTISTTCNEFKVSGSIAYNKKKSSIYISNINYCGGDNLEIYKEMNCNLYEKEKGNNLLIKSCKKKKNITLEEFLEDLEFHINDYTHSCPNFSEDSLFLEIEAINNGNQTVTFKIPLHLSENCPK